MWFQQIATTEEREGVTHLFLVDHKPPLIAENDEAGPWHNNLNTVPVMLKDGDDLIEWPSKLCDDKECVWCPSSSST